MIIKSGVVNEDGTVTLYRGLRVPKSDIGEEFEEADDYNYEGSSADSWSFNPTVAVDFAEHSNFQRNTGMQQYRVVLEARVPLERILFSFIGSNHAMGTQFDLSSEQEFIVDSMSGLKCRATMYNKFKPTMLESKKKPFDWKALILNEAKKKTKTLSGNTPQNINWIRSKPKKKLSGNTKKNIN